MVRMVGCGWWHSQREEMCLRIGRSHCTGACNPPSAVQGGGSYQRPGEHRATGMDQMIRETRGGVLLAGLQLQPPLPCFPLHSGLPDPVWKPGSRVRH